MGYHDEGSHMDFEDDEKIEVDYIRVVKETKKAWLFLLDDSDPFDPNQVWIPKSQAEIISDEVFELAEWLVVEKDLV